MTVMTMIPMHATNDKAPGIGSAQLTFMYASDVEGNADMSHGEDIRRAGRGQMTDAVL